MSHETILIVEDNPINLKLIQIVLDLEKYQIYSASDGQAMFEILRTIHPTLILMDIQLPGYSGIQLTEMLKKDEKYKDIIIVALTAYAMPGDRKKMLSAGCNEYIEKPIDVSTFPHLISDIILKHSEY